MSERMTDEEFNEAVNLAQQWWTPEHVGTRLATEAVHARRSESQQQDRIHALEVQQAELIRQAKEKDEVIKALADALVAARTAMHRGEFGGKGRDRDVPAQVDAALRTAGRLK